jgi:hypothetical protein
MLRMAHRSHSVITPHHLTSRDSRARRKAALFSSAFSVPLGDRAFERLDQPGDGGEDRAVVDQFGISGVCEPAFDGFLRASGAFLRSWTFGRFALSQFACRSHSSRCLSGRPWPSVYLASVVARARQPRTVHRAEYPQVIIWISAATIADPNEAAIKIKGRLARAARCRRPPALASTRRTRGLR